MPDAKVLAAADELAKPRAIEHVAPGSWWLADYDDENGRPAQIWAQVRVARALTNRETGAKYVHLTGIDTDGDLVELFQMRGFGVPKTLRAADARKAGLEVPANA